MPRNAAGVYSLPNPPRIPNTIIYALDENQTRDDMAAAITDSLDRYGRGPMIAPLKLPDGAVNTPALSWTSEPTSGWYRAGLNDFRFSIGGVDAFSIAGASQSITLVNTLRIERDDGLFARWENPTMPADQKKFGIQQEAGPPAAATMGPLLDDESAYVQYFQFDLTNQVNRSFAPNGLIVMDSTGLLDSFSFANEVFESFPTVNDTAAHWKINGTDFSVRRNGTVINDTQMICGNQAFGTGSVLLNTGTGTNSGFVEFVTPASASLGRIGFTPAAGMLSFYNDTGAGWAFNGNSGVMTISPATDMTARQNAVLTINVASALTHNAITCSNTAGVGTTFGAMIFDWATAIVGSITLTSTLVSYNTTSDGRLKEDICELTAVGDIIDRLEPVRFKWRDSNQKGVGFIAQHVRDVVPEAVTVPKDDRDLWQMDAGKLMPYVIAELKALRDRVDQLEG